MSSCRPTRRIAAAATTAAPPPTRTNPAVRRPGKGRGVAPGTSSDAGAPGGEESDTVIEAWAPAGKNISLRNGGMPFAAAVTM
jgi:hypothetical protein